MDWLPFLRARSMAACRASCDLIVYLLIFIFVVYFCELRCPHQPYSKGRTQAKNTDNKSYRWDFSSYSSLFYLPICQYLSLTSSPPHPSSIAPKSIQSFKGRGHKCLPHRGERTDRKQAQPIQSKEDTKQGNSPKATYYNSLSRLTITRSDELP